MIWPIDDPYGGETGWPDRRELHGEDEDPGDPEGPGEPASEPYPALHSCLATFWPANCAAPSGPSLGSHPIRSIPSKPRASTRPMRPASAMWTDLSAMPKCATARSTSKSARWS